MDETGTRCIFTKGLVTYTVHQDQYGNTGPKQGRTLTFRRQFTAWDFLFFWQQYYHQIRLTFVVFIGIVYLYFALEHFLRKFFENMFRVV